MNPETRMFLINKFLAEVVKPISRIELKRRRRIGGIGSAGPAKPKMLGPRDKTRIADMGGRTARRLDSKRSPDGTIKSLEPSKLTTMPTGFRTMQQAQKRGERVKKPEFDAEKRGLPKYERGMLQPRGSGAPKPKQPKPKDFSTPEAKIRAGRRQGGLLGAAKVKLGLNPVVKGVTSKVSGAASAVGGAVSSAVGGAAKKTVDTVKTQTKPGLDPSIGPSDSRYGRKAGRKPTLSSDIFGGLKAAGKSVRDTALKQQVGMQADAYADSFNIAGGRRMGPDYGATGRKTDRAQGVENIRSGIKQQIGTVTKTDDQGNVISAKAGVLNPQRLQRRFRARVTQQAQQKRLAKGDYSDFDKSRVDLPSYDVTDADGYTRTIGAGRQKPSDAGIAAATTQAIEKKQTQISDLTVERSKLDKTDKKGKKAIDKRINRLKRGIKRAEVAQAKVQSRTRAGRAATGEQELDQVLSQKVSEPGAPRRFEVPLASGDKITISQNVIS